MKSFFKNIPKQTVLLVSILIIIFVSPLLTNTILAPYLNTISSFFILASLFAIVNKKGKVFKSMIVLSLIITVILPFFENQAYKYFAYLFTLSIFIYTSSLMLAKIAASKRVDALLIVEAIIGYLLIGLVLLLLNQAVLVASENAFTKPDMSFADLVYFSYITLTTIGFGDISPNNELTKVIAVLGGISGQLYLTIVIAFIVGKFTSIKS
jgi:hypothetical protein